MTSDHIFNFLITSCILSILTVLILIIDKIAAKKLSPSVRGIVFLLLILCFALPLRPEISLKTIDISITQAEQAELIDVLPEYITAPVFDIESKPQTNAISILPYIYFGIVCIIIVLRISAYIFTSFKLIHRSVYVGKRKKRNILGYNECIDFYVNDDVNGAICFGIIKKKIVLPSKNFSDDEYQLMYSHELRHAMHNDVFIKMLVSLISAVHFLNPVVYLLKKRLFSVMELACDEYVIRKYDTDKKADYGTLILKTARYNRVNGMAASFASDKCDIKTRLISIMEKPKRKPTVIITLVTLIAIFGAYFGLSVNVHAVTDHMPIYGIQDSIEPGDTTTNGKDEAPAPVDIQSLSFLPPLKCETTISRRFGLGFDGIDYTADQGKSLRNEPINSIAAGTVSYIGDDIVFGKHILIDCGNGIEIIYAHLNEIYVKQGDTVDVKNVIATVGNSGECTGFCLYLAIYIDGVPVDPELYIK